MGKHFDVISINDFSPVFLQRDLLLAKNKNVELSNHLLDECSMCEDEALEEWNIMTKEIVSMYKIVRVEVERQFPTLQPQERQQICSSVSLFVNNMFATAFNEYLRKTWLRPAIEERKSGKSDFMSAPSHPKAGFRSRLDNGNLP